MKRSSDESVLPTPKTPRTLPREKTSLSNRDPVHVFCRLRPLKEDIEDTCVKLLSPTTLCMSAESKVARNHIFRHVFTAYTSQKEVFNYVAMPLLEDLINGKNGLLFTYGVTGSGKTYTLTGDQNNPGIMPRCIDALFNTIESFQAQKFLIKPDKMNGFDLQSDNEALQDRFLETKTKKLKPKKNSGDGKNVYHNDGTKIANFSENSRYTVFISYMEIYNNLVFDLLDETNAKTVQSKIIREDYQKNMYVNGVVEAEVKSATEAFELFQIGQKRKKMAHTTLNAESSRSHSIFNIRVVQLQQAVPNKQGQLMVPDQNLLKIGQLSLVDLAGSERCNRTQNTGMRLKEASSINNSLMSLRTCLEILRENQLSGSNKLVPYRDSRLTLLFRNFFEGNGQVRMIVCVNPSIQDYEENVQVLKFAEMTQDVKIPKSQSKYTPYRKTPRTIKKTISTPGIKKAKKFSFLPTVPSIRLSFENCDENENLLDGLLKAFSQREAKRKAFDAEFVKKEEHFRKRLVGVNQELLLGKSDLLSTKALAKKQRQTASNLEYKINNLESINQELSNKNEELQNVIRTLQTTIEEKSLKINQNRLECERKKHKLAMKNVKIGQELEEKLKRQRQMHEAEIKSKELKLKKVKEIIEGDLTVSPEDPPYEPQQTPTHISRKDVPRVTRNRRSRSEGEIWLEHNTIKPVALQTVFQPLMKKRKSVTKLEKAQDITNPKQSRYCLIAQTQNGEPETMMYKGDILPTCGGGAQVIFNEVERLRQESPAVLSSPTIE